VIPPRLGEYGIKDEEWLHAMQQAMYKNVEDEILLDIQKRSVEHDRWDIVYLLSYLAGLETSVLLDAENKIFIDWGLPGSVHLKQPIGAKIPFKLWVHTHPRMDTYWSRTDKDSLAFSTLLLQKASVLGRQGIKTSRNSTLVEIDECPSISDAEPLQFWTDEAIEDWETWYEDRDIMFDETNSLTNICWLATFNERR
jgi:hypothetical protein